MVFQLATRCPVVRLVMLAGVEKRIGVTKVMIDRTQSARNPSRPDIGVPGTLYPFGTEARVCGIVEKLVEKIENAGTVRAPRGSRRIS